jgi:thioredoxin 1
MTRQFLEFIAREEKPVLADFWAEWCGPCRMMEPVLKELAGEWKGKAVVVKVNSDEQPQLAQRFGISALPTMVLFHKGREVHRVSGARPVAALKAEFASWVA